MPLAWRAIVTTHEGLIDRPKDPARPEAGWPERGKDQTGKPWVDGKTWAVARVLDDHMGKDGTCWVSYATIAAHARIGRTAAKEGVARLVGAGLLELRQRRIGPARSDTNLYSALGVGPQRPGGGAATGGGWGRSGPQSPQEVEGLPGPPDGEPVGCSMCGTRAELDEGLCRRCFEGWYGGEREWAA